MSQFNIIRGVKGFYRLYDYGLRWTRMSTSQSQHRQEILSFWYKHGLAATTEAFHISRRTLYTWKQKMRLGNGHLSALDPLSTRPKRVRQRIWHTDIILEIKRLRTVHPHLGKEKIHILLEPFCTEYRLTCPSVRTIGRIIADDPYKMRRVPERYSHFGKPRKERKQQQKQRKPKDFVSLYPGHCGSFDTVERIINGRRRYIITFTDTYSRFAFAWETESHASRAATEFFTLVTQLFPYELRYILTDNGSEFAKAFDQEIRRLHKIHWYTYPRTPKMNAHVERFNRTIQEEFINFHTNTLLNPDLFNAELIKYLLWYNLERPHWSLNLQSPVQFLQSKHPECNMWWPDTRGCFLSVKMVY